MTIATKRLILRPFKSDDIEAIHHYSSKESVTKFMLWGPNTYDETAKFVHSVLKKNQENPRYDYDFVVTLKNGTVIGACGIYFKDFIEPPFLGWVYDDAYWNQGYGTEVGKALLSYAFNRLKLPVVRATVDDENIGSYRIMEKIGMRHVKTQYREFSKLGKRLERLYELSALEYKLNNHKTFI